MELTKVESHKGTTSTCQYHHNTTMHKEVKKIKVKRRRSQIIKYPEASKNRSNHAKIVLLFFQLTITTKTKCSLLPEVGKRHKAPFNKSEGNNQSPLKRAMQLSKKRMAPIQRQFHGRKKTSVNKTKQSENALKENIHDDAVNRPTANITEKEETVEITDVSTLNSTSNDSSSGEGQRKRFLEIL